MLKAIDETKSAKEYAKLIERVGVTWAIEGSAAKSRLEILTTDEVGKDLYRIKELLKDGIPWMQTITLTSEVESEEKLNEAKKVMVRMFENEVVAMPQDELGRRCLGEFLVLSDFSACLRLCNVA